VALDNHGPCVAGVMTPEFTDSVSSFRDLAERVESGH
jgi:hypothetical protein